MVKPMYSSFQLEEGGKINSEKGVEFARTGKLFFTIRFMKMALIKKISPPCKKKYIKFPGERSSDLIFLQLKVHYERFLRSFFHVFILYLVMKIH